MIVNPPLSWQKPPKHRRSLEEFVGWARSSGSDLSAQWGRLYHLGRSVSHILELGFGEGRSTSAWLWSGVGKLVSYDRISSPEVALLKRLALQEEMTDFTFVKGDVHELSAMATGGLFVDLGAIGSEITEVLDRYGKEAEHWIAIHGTEEAGVEAGIRRFLDSQDRWELLAHYQDYNGLVVLDRTL